jgi:hypothetical protein
MSANFNPTEIVFLAIAPWGKWFFRWLMLVWATRGIKSATARAKIISQLPALFHRTNSRKILPSDEPDRQTLRPADGRAATRRSRRRGRRGRRRRQ